MMSLSRITLSVCFIACIISLSCSGYQSNPTVPDEIGQTASAATSVPATSPTHLWGIYDVYIDVPAKKATAVANRTSMFSVNVVNILNGKPTSLAFKIHDVITDPGNEFIDIDIDVKLTHPFPGLPQYNGYDVRGIFIGNGSATLQYNSDLKYAAYNSNDQVMYDYDLSDPTADPYSGPVGMPDGYTRWWNPTEFANPSMPLFGYTPGKVATPSYNGTATLNPYKYFADGLSADKNLWDFLTSTNQSGVFSSGVQNVRNYYLRFPTPNPAIKFNYAVLANWKGPKQADHPANASEAVALKAQITPSLYYVNPTTKGGNLILDLSVFDWDSTLSAGIMEDYSIIIESSVLSTPVAFTNLTPTGSGDHYYTYHIDIPADNLTSAQGNWFWVIVEDSKFDYTNDFGVSNLAGTDKLAALFRFDLPVSNQLNNTPPTITGITDDIPPAGLNTQVNSGNTAVTYIALFDDPDVGQTHTVTWYIEDGTATGPSDPPDSLPYNWAPKALGPYKIWVKVDDGFGAVTGGPYTVTKIKIGWVATWGGPQDWDIGWDLAFDSSGNVYIVGTFKGSNVDFDPDPVKQDLHSANGSNFDAFLCKYSSSGTYIWGKHWGGTNEDYAKGVAVSGNNVYVSGYFRTTTPEQVDFDPDPTKTYYKTSNGESGWLCKQFRP